MESYLDECCFKRTSCFSFDDDGVLPGCGHRLCPLSHDNFINHLNVAEYFGTIGFAYFGTNRIFFFGVASVITALTLIITVYGCLALSVDKRVVENTYWVAGDIHNITSNSDYSIYVGLRSAVYVNCKYYQGYYQVGDNCFQKSILFTQCDGTVASKACDNCDGAASKFIITAISSCAGLALGFLSAQTRMRKKADVPIQKILGSIGDTTGTL